MCLRSMVHCTVVLCLMKPCVLVSFFSVRCTTCCWWYCHWYWSICVCFSEFHWKSRFKMHHFAMSIVFAIVLLESPCLQGQLSLCLLTKFTFHYQIIWGCLTKICCLVVEKTGVLSYHPIIYVSRHITTYILKLATEGWNV
jgi:hypothetical protein